MPGFVPNVSQTAAEVSTVISLVVIHMGIAILPASAVKHSITSVIACDIVDQIPMSEIGIAASKGVRPAGVDNFRSFALEKLGRARKSLCADES
jgi:DNA-binding transcriptional LysR family regulator